MRRGGSGRIGRASAAMLRAGATMLVAALLAGACGGSSANGARSRPSQPGTTSGTGRVPSSSTSTSTTRPRPNPVAADQLAQYVLTASINAAKQIYDQSYDYSTVSPADLSPLVPNTHFAPVEQASTTVVGVLAQDRNDVLLVMRSASGRWYCITENTMDGILYGEGSTRDSVDSNGQCRRNSWPAPGTDQSPF